MRKYLIAGNWKQMGTIDWAQKFSTGVLKPITFEAEDMDVVLAPSALHMRLVQESLAGSQIQLCGQNISMHGNGAFTGEMSAEMLADAGVNWVLLGHTERRKIYGETDEIVAQKAKMAQAQGLNMIIGIGETLTERVQRKTNEVNARQLAAIHKEVTDWSKISIAYQPVWTINTGRTASHDQVQETQGAVREWLQTNVSKECAENIRIIYGGAVSHLNIKKLINEPDVDGFLVGAMALNESFRDIIGWCDDHHDKK